MVVTTQSAIGEYYPPSAGYVYPYQTWTQPCTVKKVTETMEYDDKGNLVKRTIVTEESTPRTYQQPYIWNGIEPKF